MTNDIFGDLVLGRNEPYHIKGAVPEVARGSWVPSLRRARNETAAPKGLNP